MGESNNKTPLNLSGMELSPLKEKILARWRDANPSPTDRDIARIGAMISDMPSDAKLFAIAIIELGGLGSDPIPMPRSEAQILLSKSKDGFASAAEKLGEWVHAKVDKGGGGKKSRYSILQNVLDPQKKAACSSGRFYGNEPACGAGHFPQNRPVGQATFLKDRGGNPDSSQKGGNLVREVATPNEGIGSDGPIPRPQPLESPNPDLSKSDLMRANPDFARALTNERPGKRGPRDPFNLNPMTRKAEESVWWDSVDGRVHVTNGFAAELASILPEGEDLQINIDAVAQWLPKYESGIGLMVAVRSQITKRSQDLKRMKSRIYNKQSVDNNDLEVYKHPVTGEIIPMLEYVRIMDEERKNGRRAR
jgi:hypothetical protein